MIKHWVAAHPGPIKPKFHQYIIGQYKSSLSRQVAEAVRIQMRGSVLNSVGVFNRSKLTRLVVDKDWDKKVWDDSWERRTIQERITQSLSEDGVEKLKEVSDNRLPGKRLRNEDTQINKMRKEN